MHTVDTLKNILHAHAAIKVDARVLGINQLAELVSQAACSEAKIILANANALSKEAVEKLAVTGGDAVVFEL